MKPAWIAVDALVNRQASERWIVGFLRSERRTMPESIAKFFVGHRLEGRSVGDWIEVAQTVVGNLPE